MVVNSLLARAAELILKSHYITVLTGAGISTPSGIPDFRSPKSGLWTKSNPLIAASLDTFRIRPQSFFDWVRPFMNTLFQAAPNPAHVALVKLEKMGRVQSIITQNIDNLHQKAGSRNVIEVHGHIRQATCVRCYHTVSTDTLLKRIIHEQLIPKCERCGGVLKPNVILIGEQLPVKAIKAARKEARACDLMLVLGTSLHMAPASDLPLIAQENGAHVIVINREPTFLDKRATLVIRDDLAHALPGIITKIQKPGFLSLV